MISIGVLLEDALWSAIAAGGFAILFNVPARALPGAMLTGAAGHASRTLLMQLGMGIELASLIGAFIIGLLGFGLSVWMRSPRLLFTITGVIPMVPGVFAYRTVIGIISIVSASTSDAGPVLVEATINGIKTTLILMALAAGIAAPTLLFFRRRRLI